MSFVSQRTHGRHRASLPAHSPSAGQRRNRETDTDTLDGRETDNWERGYYYCPNCQENFDHLAEVRQEPKNNQQQTR